MNTLLLRFLRVLSIFLTVSFFILQPASAQDVDVGKDLFKTNCASCHYLGPHEKKLIGPGLNEEIFHV